MLAVDSGSRYFLYDQPCDMRKGFDSLINLVEGRMPTAPSSGDYFLFINKRGTMVKILRWESSGYAIYFKRLEQGTFEHPDSRELSRQQLLCLLEGMHLESIRSRKRYEYKEKK
jgi:transposase